MCVDLHTIFNHIHTWICLSFVKVVGEVILVMSRLLILFVLIGVFQALLSHARHVNIDVKAPWPRYTSSSIVELAEFISQQKDDSMYWNFVDAMCVRAVETNEVIRQTSNDAVVEVQSIAFDAAASVIPPSMHSLMETFIGVGGFVPSVSTYIVDHHC